MSLPTIDAYRQEAKEIREKLKKPWVQEFLIKYYPHVANDEKFKAKFKNFLFGRSWWSGYTGQNPFMANLKEFYQFKLKEYERSAIEG